MKPSPIRSDKSVVRRNIAHLQIERAKLKTQIISRIAQSAAMNGLGNEAEIKRRRKCWVRMMDFMANSSLFIFHKDWNIRKFCLSLLKEPSQMQN